MLDEQVNKEFKKLVVLAILPALVTCIGLIIGAYFVRPVEVVYKYVHPEKIVYRDRIKYKEKAPTNPCKTSTGVVQTIWTEKVREGGDGKTSEDWHWESDVTYLLDDGTTIACHYSWGNLQKYLKPGMKIKTSTAGQL